MKMYLRGYVWTNEQVENYIKMKDAEDFELMKTISGAVQAAMESLGGELLKYLEEASRTWEEDKEEKPVEGKQEEHHTSLLRKMFGDFLGPPKDHDDGHGDAHGGKKHKEDPIANENEMAKVNDDLKKRLFMTFKNFKKGHGMVMW